MKIFTTWHVSCLLEFNKKILLIKSPHEPANGFHIPSGNVFTTEPIEDCVKRIVDLHTGIKMENPTLIGIYQYIREHEYAYHFLFYQQMSDWDVVKLKLRSDEIDVIRFYSNEELLEYIGSAQNNVQIHHKLAIHQVLENNIQSLKFQIIRD
jgi:ADP-ribose pyrophosphatase YjhB (NUDIX family)